MKLFASSVLLSHSLFFFFDICRLVHQNSRTFTDISGTEYITSIHCQTILVVYNRGYRQASAREKREILNYYALADGHACSAAEPGLAPLQRNGIGRGRAEARETAARPGGSRGLALATPPVLRN